MVRRNSASGAADDPTAGRVRATGRARIFVDPVDDWTRVA